MQLKKYIKQQLREALNPYQEQLDAILDKISSHGLESLSPEERIRLDRISSGAGLNPQDTLQRVHEYLDEKLSIDVDDDREEPHHKLIYTQVKGEMFYLICQLLATRYEGGSYVISLNQTLVDDVANDFEIPEELAIKCIHTWIVVNTDIIRKVDSIQTFDPEKISMSKLYGDSDYDEEEEEVKFNEEGLRVIMEELEARKSEIKAPDMEFFADFYQNLLEIYSGNKHLGTLEVAQDHSFFRSDELRYNMHADNTNIVTKLIGVLNHFIK